MANRISATIDVEQLQQNHYDRIAGEYEEHYDDPASQAYRHRFIYQPMFEGINLRGQQVLEAMCGSGQTTDFLLSRGAHVTGLDISERVIESFQARWPEASSVCSSILNSGLASESFDCVTVTGGLHHMHPHLNETVQELHRLLKKGGYLCFMEPHASSLPDLFRRVWYKHDRFFSDNEAAIEVDLLRETFADCFQLRQENYQGNVAYLLVLNSMIFRLPTNWKPAYAPALFAIEAFLNKFAGKILSCYVVAQWQKI